MPNPLLLETIRIENGEISDLAYHQVRFEKSRKELFGLRAHPQLQEYITPPQTGLYRCRIVYEQTIQQIEYLPYTPKKIETLKIVTYDIEYHYKYADREIFNTLLQNNPEADEIIIEKEGLITDTTISNIALFDGSKWVTPANPLLEGTMRAKLLDEGFLYPQTIYTKDLSDYSHVALMNAMIGFKILKDVRILTS
ncbi:MAG: aminotransferase class IV [Campylobacterales bacterium]|nr:aminotransferase class IV [Campylobacterales bacterium]